MTPIVLTENGEEEEGGVATTATPPPTEASVTGGVVVVAARSTSLGKGGESGESRPLAASPSTEAEDDAGVRGASAVDGGGPAAADTHASKPVAMEEATGGREGSRPGGWAEVMAPLASTKPSSPGTKISTDKATAVGDESLPLPPTTVAMANHGAAKTLSANQAAVAGELTVSAAKMAASQRGSLAAGAAQAANSGQGVFRTVVKSTEQLFMEDTQVYLGCAVCGVKYLVEAVDPGPSKSTQGEFERNVFHLVRTCVAYRVPRTM